MAVIEWDARLRVRDWSRRAEDMFGWTSEEALGRSCRELGLIAAEEQGSRQRWLRELRTELGALPEVVCRCWRRDGHVLMVEEVSEYLYAFDRAFFHVATHLAGAGLAGRARSAGVCRAAERGRVARESRPRHAQPVTGRPAG